MINSISNSLPQNNVHQSSSTSAAAQKAAPQREDQTSKGAVLSQDQVTLKSTANVDQDGGSK
jgi:hypothetical protein